MACKTLREAFLKHMMEDGVYPSAKVIKQTEKELRDFFAHQTMKCKTAQELFDLVFKDVSAEPEE